MSQPTPVGESLAHIEATALALARKWNLVTETGEIVCLKGCGKQATLPSLCCPTCLAAHRGHWR